MKGLSAVACALAICVGLACGGRSASPAVAMPGDAAQAFPCSRSGHPHAAVDAKVIQPGVYDMVVVATSGREAGSRAVGTLTLATATPADVSPRTGEQADDGSHPIFMWGSLVMNFVGIGAAGLIESHGMAPRPASADPVFPGVVIRHAIPGMDVDGWTPPSGVLIPIMWVGDSNNARRSIVDPKSGNVVTVLDGPGICMFLFRASAAGLGGPWESSGGLRDPHGYFCARRHAD